MNIKNKELINIKIDVNMNGNTVNETTTNEEIFTKRELIVNYGIDMITIPDEYEIKMRLF